MSRKRRRKGGLPGKGVEPKVVFTEAEGDEYSVIDHPDIEELRRQLDFGGQREMWAALTSTRCSGPSD